HGHLMFADQRNNLEDGMIQDPPCIDWKRPGLSLEGFVYGLQHAQGKDGSDWLEFRKEDIGQGLVKPSPQVLHVGRCTGRLQVQGAKEMMVDCPFQLDEIVIGGIPDRPRQLFQLLLGVVRYGELIEPVKDRALGACMPPCKASHPSLLCSRT